MITWIMIIWVHFPTAASIEVVPGIREYLTEEACLAADPHRGLGSDVKILMALCVQGKVSHKAGTWVKP